MTKPEFTIDIFIQSDEYHWGDETTSIRTILGSCVAICLWHPGKKLGGMCHCLLPVRGNPRENSALSARYVDESLLLFKEEIKNAGLRTIDFTAKLYGGSNMFSKFESGDLMKVGERNIAEAKKGLESMGIKIIFEDVGGTKPRSLRFDLWDGETYIRQTKEADHG